MVSAEIKNAVNSTIDQFLDQMAMAMENEDEWAAFINILERRRVAIKARLVNGKG